MALSTWSRILNTTQMKNDYSEKPSGLRWRSNTIFILSTVTVGLFADYFSYSLVVPVIPFLLEDRIGVSNSEVQRYTSALLAVFAGSSVVFSPVAGVIADKVSTRQGPFLIGLSSMLGATLLLFLGTNVPVLVLARVLQGMASAIVWTVGLAMCIETVGTENLGKAIGTIFSFIMAGALWAPLLGGLLYKKTGHLGVLGLNLAILGLDFIMRVLVIEKKVALRYGLEDSSQQPNGNTNGDTNEEGNNQTVRESNDEEQPLLGWQEEDVSEFKLPENPSKLSQMIPILPCLLHPGLLTALLLALMQGFLLGSFDATVTTVSREFFDFDSFRASLLFLPIGTTDFVCGPIAGWLVDKYGTKPVSVISFVYLVPTLVLLRLPHAGGFDQVLLFGFLLGLVGIGIASIGAPGIVEAGAIVDKYHKANPDFFGEGGAYAQLYGVNSAMYNIGLTAGPELAGELKEIIGYGNMNIVIAIICAITAVLSFLYVGGRPKILRKRKNSL